MSRIVTIAIILVLTAVAGCGNTRFPDTEIKPVKGFSLGSAKFTPFKERPTAQELYDATCKLYDSFDSVAATYEVREQEVSSWVIASKGKLEDIEQDVNKYQIELRIIPPYKLLSKQDMSVIVDNKDSSIWYWPNKNEYGRFPAHKTVSHKVEVMFDLVSEQPTEEMSLLRDTTINGSDVYVLEVRLAEKKFKNGRQPARINRFYLGQSDLLPRKIELLEKRNREEEKLGVPRNGQVETFTGVRVNVPLKDDLFPTSPPKGAKKSDLFTHKSR